MNKKLLMGQAIILAAGESSRCWPLNQGHKSQIKTLGKPLIYWTIKGVSRKGIKDIVLVIGPNSSLREELALISKDLNIALSFIVQEKPLGTGDAIFRAKELISQPFFVFWPFEIIAGEIIGKIIEANNAKPSSLILTGVETSTPWDYGILKFENGKAVEIIEKPSLGKEPSNIKTLGIYFLHPVFFDYYKKLSKRHDKDFIDALNLYLKDKEAKVIFLEKDSSLKYPWDFLKILKIIFESGEFKHFISPSAQIGKNVSIKGKVYIGDNVVVGENTIISGFCFIGKNCKIGPNNVLRGPVNLENDVVTGAFTEIKNCLIQQGTHVHSGYFGDSIIGQNCRFGAGFTTANRRIDRANIKPVVKGKKIDTGLTYFGTAVGNNTCFGIHSGVMPGVLIGSNCIIGPGTLVFENIEDNTTFFTKFKGIKKQ